MMQAKNYKAAKIREEDITWAQAPNHQILIQKSANYPALLKEISDFPQHLYVMGQTEILSYPQIAIVGSRHPTPIGLEIAKEMAFALSVSGLTITSGLALGIDAAAHAGALQAKGTSIAVLGHGLSFIYPHVHQTLADDLVKQGGALVSEFSLHQPVRAYHFPKRNRIISGLSIGTLVVEATKRSGSLITARFAGEQNREVFVIPGSIKNPLSKGCHRLIQEGACLVQDVNDILAIIRPLVINLCDFLSLNVAQNKDIDTHTLAWKERKLLECVGFDVASIDLLMARMGRLANEVTSIVSALELKGYIQFVPGGVVRTH